MRNPALFTDRMVVRDMCVRGVGREESFSAEPVFGLGVVLGVTQVTVTLALSLEKGRGLLMLCCTRLRYRA